jgi:hypothetical protein
MPVAANPALGIRLMSSIESVTFSIFFPIRQQYGGNSRFYLYYHGREPSGNRDHAAVEQKHMVNGDLQERLTVSINPQEGSKRANYAWQLDEEMADAFWELEVLIELASTHRRDLRVFLVRCIQDATSDPTKPIRAVFLTSAQFYDS